MKVEHWCKSAQGSRAVARVLLRGGEKWEDKEILHLLFKTFLKNF